MKEYARAAELREALGPFQRRKDERQRIKAVARLGGQHALVSSGAVGGRPVTPYSRTNRGRAASCQRRRRPISRVPEVDPVYHVAFPAYAVAQLPDAIAFTGNDLRAETDMKTLPSSGVARRAQLTAVSPRPSAPDKTAGLT